jgi:hypothetical protein
MKKILRICGIVALIVFFVGCGEWNQFKDSSLSYKSITGRTGDVHVLGPDGKMAYDYPNATILYAHADTTTLLIKDAQGNEKYIQGFAVIDLK